MTHVFTYGSLMFDPIWARVVAGRNDKCTAILHGYERKGLRNEVYPAVIPAAVPSQVQGILRLDVSSADLDRLDQFEGRYYCRKTVQVMTENIGITEAEVYILREVYYPLISSTEWDPAHFGREEMHHFLQTYMNAHGPQQEDDQ